jgi:hypothetical protein
MHTAAVALMQWQDTKLHARVAALLQWQVLKLIDRESWKINVKIGVGPLKAPLVPSCPS